MVACEILRPLTYVPLVLFRSVTMNRPSRKSSRAWCFETFPLGSIRSLPWTRPTLISFLSKVSLRSAPPFSLMTIVNIKGGVLRSPHVTLHGRAAAPIVEAGTQPCQPNRSVRTGGAPGCASVPAYGGAEAVAPAELSDPLRLHVGGHLAEQLAREGDDVARLEPAAPQLAVDRPRKDRQSPRVTCARCFAKGESHVVGSRR